MSESKLTSQLTIGLFQSLSLCGLRTKILKNIAFKAPPVSYTLKARRKSALDLMKQVGSQSLIPVSDSDLEIRMKSKSYDNESIQQLMLDDLIDELSMAEKPQQVHYLDSDQYPRHDFYLVDGDGKEIMIPPQQNTVISGYFLKTKKGNRVASLHLTDIQHPSEYVMLFSHGNASDLGYMIDTLLDLQINLKMSVFAYEYSGYGQSTGKTTDVNIIRDIQTAYEFLINDLHYDPTKVIVYGYSIGSGPSVTLVSDQAYPVGGLIIHSGFLSGLRVVHTEIKKTPFYDLFPNGDRIRDVTCPVLVMHGTEDQVIDVKHSQLLANHCQRLWDYWQVEQAGHSGIDTDDQHRRVYFSKLRGFLKFIMDENTQVKGLIQRNTASPTNKKTHYYNTIKEFQLNTFQASN